MPLHIMGVSAPEKARRICGELRVVPRKDLPFVPIVGMMGFFCCPSPV